MSERERPVANWWHLKGSRPYVTEHIDIMQLKELGKRWVTKAVMLLGDLSCGKATIASCLCPLI
jgi:hypothetical protein